ncbi:sulfotransferase family 2 domain-containing protein [Prosthecobacter fluviatilis]|uniref:Sulfotransferase family 2 domain-containing protein n=1 Tax=Prosthecobacter fluviatilis TaxID=445931 RepID=A0ABW0KXB0_9BACT
MIYPNPQIYPHLKTIFVHVPKTAGTSIEKRLRENNGVVVGGHTTAEGFRKKYPGVFDDYYKFAVVRHPLSRFVSAFFYLLDRPINLNLRNKIVHECATLDTFISCVEQKPDVISQIVHLFPQHTFICDAQDRVLVNDVYKFENLPEEWLRICQTIGLPHEPLDILNPSSAGQLEIANKSRLVDLVTSLYRKDFELFGFNSKG